ncbi:alpha/beta-hydrolase, partial [Clavulina sp. PMI_390]
VVLIHGYKIPSIVFKDVQDRLIAAGFLVLTYDIYGRGYSQAPQDTTLPVYITQLALLMQHIGWDKARIVGLSLGGAIAAGFATEFPNLVDSDVALLASVGNFTDAHPFDASYAVLTHPFFLWIYLLLAKKPTLPPPPKDPLEAIGQLHTLQMIALPHYIHLLALTVRHGPLRGMGPIFANLGKMPIRTLLVHGADDDFVEYRRYFEPALTKYFPKAKVVVLEHGRHELAATHPDEVANALVEFFNSA